MLGSRRLVAIGFTGFVALILVGGIVFPDPGSTDIVNGVVVRIPPCEPPPIRDFWGTGVACAVAWLPATWVLRSRAVLGVWALALLVGFVCCFFMRPPFGIVLAVGMALKVSGVATLAASRA